MKSAVCSFVAVLCALAAVITIYNGEATWFFAIATIGFAKNAARIVAFCCATRTLSELTSTTMPTWPKSC